MSICKRRGVGAPSPVPASMASALSRATASPGAHPEVGGRGDSRAGRRLRWLIGAGLLLLVFAWRPIGRAWMASAPVVGDERPGATIRTLPAAPPGVRGQEAIGRQYLIEDARPFEKWFGDGRRYLARQELEQAIWAFRKAVRMKPLSASAWFLLGVAYTRRADDGLPGDATDWIELAVRAFETAAGIADYLPAWYNLGHLQARRGDAAAARRSWEHILMVAPRTALAQRASRALGRLDDAVTLPDALTEAWP